MTHENRNKYRLFYTLVFILITTVFWLLLHYRSHVRRLSPEFRKLYQVIRLIETYYVEEIDLARVSESGLHGLLRELTPSGFVVNDDSLAPGEIGLVLYPRNGSPLVITTVPGSPADLAPIETGDLLLAIDEKSIYHEPFARIQTLLRGEVQSSVQLELFSAQFEKNYTVTLKRTEIRQPPVLAGTLPDARTGYLRPGEISEEAAAALAQRLDAMLQNGIERLLLDLRQTSQGTLTGTIGILSLFLPAKELVLQSVGTEPPGTKKYYTRRPRKIYTLPLVVVINHGTSRWAEILAGSLQDLDRAVVAGENSFGLADVYNPVSLKDHIRIQLPTTRLLTANGRCFGRKIDSTSFWQELKQVAHDSIRIQRGAFKTRAGRLVYAGEGITPDEIIPSPPVINLELSALLPEFLSVSDLAGSEKQLFRRFKNFASEKSVHISESEWNKLALEIKNQIRFFRIQVVTGLEPAFKESLRHDSQIQHLLLNLDQLIGKNELQVRSDKTRAPLSTPN